MNAKTKGILSLFISILLVLPNAAPVAAFAEQRSVTLDNHASASEQATTVTNVRIDGVNKSQAGKELDPTAAVTTAEGAAWEIGALWVRDDLSFATTAQEGHTYLPVLAFFVPQEYSLEGDAVSVTLSDSLTNIGGGKSSADEDNLDLIKSLDDMMAAAAKAPETETAAAPAAAATTAPAASPEDTPASTATQPATASAEPVPAAQESAPTPAPASPAPEPPATPAQTEQEPQAENSTPKPATTN